MVNQLARWARVVTVNRRKDGNLHEQDLASELAYIFKPAMRQLEDIPQRHQPQHQLRTGTGTPRVSVLDPSSCELLLLNSYR